MLAALLAAVILGCAEAPSPSASVERYAVYEATFEASTGAGSPYLEIEATATVGRPAGEPWEIPLFWDGGPTWKLRVSPDSEGAWSYRIASNDPGLDGATGAFECIPSDRPGGLQAMPDSPSHFARRTGDPFWFMGDTAWGYFTDDEAEQHDRERAEYYAKTRAAQGFNVIHSMMMSEQGVGNNGGPPFDDMETQKINPAYWQEVDERLRFANQQGLTVGMAIAWGDKRGEPFAWSQFPDLEARKRYARYMAARYSAHDVYFLVSGEWNFEVRAREDRQTAAEVFDEFVQIGEALESADAHGRMIGIHPWTAYGGVRDFNAASWMSFADYQQNYDDLHERALFAGRLPRPVVNLEYGYHLRDQDGDGKPDKSNSYTLEDMRYSSWDIVTAGGYLVTGFGTTYFAGYRDPGPFDVDHPRNDDWERQIGYIKSFFEQLEWWKLIPADELVSSPEPRDDDRDVAPVRGNRRLQPPLRTYWAMTEPGKVYLLYVRGARRSLTLGVDSYPGTFRARQFDPRTGAYEDLGTVELRAGWREPIEYQYTPPDEQDWVLLLERQ